METFLRYLIENFLGSADAVEIRTQAATHKVTFILTIPSDLVGRLIGKQGRTIEAVRNLLNASAALNGRRAVLQIAEKK